MTHIVSYTLPQMYVLFDVALLLHHMRTILVIRTRSPLNLSHAEGFFFSLLVLVCVRCCLVVFSCSSEPSSCTLY